MHSQIFHSELSTTTKPGIHIANNESRPGDAILLTVPNKAAGIKTVLGLSLFLSNIQKCSKESQIKNESIR